MPLLICPNCQTGMKEITRETVQIDICPTCNGVWLDRGELNKLLEVNRHEQETFYRQEMPQKRAMPNHVPQETYHPSSGKYYKKKSKLESVFDIFDL